VAEKTLGRLRETHKEHQIQDATFKLIDELRQKKFEWEQMKHSAAQTVVRDAFKELDC
jgi:hypothetical protein